MLENYVIPESEMTTMALRHAFEMGYDKGRKDCDDAYQRAIEEHFNPKGRNTQEF